MGLILISRKRQHKDNLTTRFQRCKALDMHFTMYVMLLQGHLRTGILQQLLMFPIKFKTQTETPRRKQGAIAIYFLWERENELEKGISRATEGPKNSKSTRDGNAPQGMSQIPTTPERFSELRYNSYCHRVSYQHSSTHWKIFWLFKKRGSFE